MNVGVQLSGVAGRIPTCWIGDAVPLERRETAVTHGLGRIPIAPVPAPRVPPLAASPSLRGAGGDGLELTAELVEEPKMTVDVCTCARSARIPGHWSCLLFKILP